MQSTPKLNIQPLGEAAFTVTLAEAISAEASTRVLALRQAILAADLPGVRGIVPAYTSLLVRFDPDRTVPSKLLDVLTELCQHCTEIGSCRWKACRGAGDLWGHIRSGPGGGF